MPYKYPRVGPAHDGMRVLMPPKRSNGRDLSARKRKASPRTGEAFVLPEPAAYSTARRKLVLLYFRMASVMSRGSLPPRCWMLTKRVLLDGLR